MSTFFYYLWRFILASMAWLAAVIVAALVIATLLVAAGGFEPVDQVAIENLLQGGLKYVVPIAFYVAIGTFIPSLFIIVWAEFAAHRSWLFYSRAALLTGVGIVGVVFSLLLISREVAEPWAWGLLTAMIAVAGIVAGSVYWLIAGRSAGLRS